jgi:hypothetical protein
MKLDINTPRGQKTLLDEQEAKKLFLTEYPDFQYVETPKERPADVDAILIVSGEVAGIVETKCRYDMDVDKFHRAYKSEWLLTFAKLEKIKAISLALRVPAFGFLYIVKSKTLLVQPLVDERGEYSIDFYVRTTETRQNVNGGLISRENAYINMKNAKVIT